MNNESSKNEHDINKIKNYYDKHWNQEKEKNTHIGWGYDQKRIHNTIFEFITNEEPGLVLEIGCGKGDLTTKLSKKYKKIVSFDISSGGINKARQRIEKNCICEFLISDATKLPFCNNIFDTVIFSEVLEHTLDQKKCISEIHRILKPNGVLILTTPNSGGIHRNLKKIISKLLNKPFRFSSQITDNPLSSLELELLLLPYFFILKKRGLIYSLPYLHILKSKNLINISKRISEFIENNNYFPNLGLYHCILCYPKKLNGDKL